MEINRQRIKERENELIHFEGFLPFEILSRIDFIKRNDYLKSKGLFDEIQKQNLKHRINSSKYGEEYKQKVLKDWILGNPKFKDCVL